MRCVGGPLDNVDVSDHGRELMMLEPDEIYRLRTGLDLDSTPIDGQMKVKHHTYTNRGGEYVHDAQCCPVESHSDWTFKQTGKRP